MYGNGDARRPPPTNGLVLLDEEQHRQLGTRDQTQHQHQSQGRGWGNGPSRAHMPSEPRFPMTFPAVAADSPETVSSSSASASAYAPTATEWMYARRSGTTQVGAATRTDFRSTTAGQDMAARPTDASVFSTGNYDEDSRMYGGDMHSVTGPGSVLGLDAPLPGNDGGGQPQRGVQFSVLYSWVGLAVGLALGIMFSHLDVSALAAQWISLPGELFLRALKCLVVPYVFCAVAVAIGDLMYVGKGPTVGKQTLRCLVIFWFASTAIGLGVALLFRTQFRNPIKMQYPKNAIAFTCTNGALMEQHLNGSVSCTTDPRMGVSMTNMFQVTDVKRFFINNIDSALSLAEFSQQVITTLESIVPSNVTVALTNGHLPSIILAAMAVGTVAGHSYFRKTQRINYVYIMLLQLRNTFFRALEWVMWTTPIAVVSIIAGTFASNEVSLWDDHKVVMYGVAILLAGVSYFAVVLPVIVFLLTLTNPYKHATHMIPAYTVAFAGASSLATTPVTLTCVQRAQICSPSLANFFVSFGVSCNMSGNGFLYPVGVIFLAESAGLGDEITAVRMAMLCVFGFLACAIMPPIPATSSQVILGVYMITFNVSEIPVAMAMLTAMEPIVDRIVTLCNVQDDIMALKVIAENTDETVTGEFLGQRF